MSPAHNQPKPPHLFTELSEQALLEAVLERLVERLAGRAASLLAARQENDSDNRSPWMAIGSAASYLDGPKQRLYRLTASGEIPHYKQEGRLLFHRQELEQWLAGFAQGERRSLSPPASI